MLVGQRDQIQFYIYDFWSDQNYDNNHSAFTAITAAWLPRRSVLPIEVNRHWNGSAYSHIFDKIIIIKYMIPRVADEIQKKNDW